MTYCYGDESESIRTGVQEDRDSGKRGGTSAAQWRKEHRKF